MTIVNCTDIGLKGLNKLTSHKNYFGMDNMYVNQL